MHVGVAGSAHDAVLRQDEVVTVDVEVPSRTDQGHDRQDQRKMRGDPRIDARRGPLEPEAAVEVVADGGDDEEHEQRNEAPVDEE